MTSTTARAATMPPRLLDQINAPASVLFRVDGMRLVDTGQRIPLKGGGAALRTADRPL